MYEKIKQELASGTLGDIQMVTSTFCIHRNYPDREKGDSSLFSLGYYGIQLANLVFRNEQPETIKAVASYQPTGKSLV